MTSWLIAAGLLGVLGCVHTATTGCKNCVVLGKEEKAMFRAHSDSCLPQSQVDPKLVDAMLNGELIDDRALKKHVYCVLLKCKVISKDGKLQKTALMGKTSLSIDGKNVTKVLESCAEQSGDTPEDVAWNLLRCGYEKKAVLFDYMPTDGVSGDIENNSN
ncbi:B2 protein [Aphomia sociella]